MTKLAMIDSILASVAVRSEHEVAWICEEIAEIEHCAEQVITAGADRGGQVITALEALRSNSNNSNHLRDLRTGYRLAGEVLSRALEAAMPAGGELRETVVNVLATRVAREVEIRGVFSLAGRE